MATEFGLAQVSEIFDAAFGKPLDAKAYELWRTVFKKIDDAILVKAAYQLALRREKTNKISPGEMRAALETMGIYINNHRSLSSFQDDPMVRMLESRYKGECDAEGISLADFLKNEGLSSWREAVEKYKDKPEPALPRSKDNIKLL